MSRELTLYLVYKGASDNQCTKLLKVLPEIFMPKLAALLSFLNFLVPGAKLSFVSRLLVSKYSKHGAPSLGIKIAFSF